MILAVAYLTLAERQSMGSIQRCRGLNIPSVFGVLQPLTDGLTLFVKETVLLSDANLNHLFTSSFYYIFWVCLLRVSYLLEKVWFI